MGEGRSQSKGTYLRVPASLQVELDHGDEHGAVQRMLQNTVSGRTSTETKGEHVPYSARW